MKPSSDMGDDWEEYAGDCRVSECDRPAAEGRSLCHMHHKRQVRGTPMDAEGRPQYSSRWDMLCAAALAWADADPEDDEGYRLLCARFRRAVRAYTSKPKMTR